MDVEATQRMYVGLASLLFAALAYSLLGVMYQTLVSVGDNPSSHAEIMLQASLIGGPTPPACVSDRKCSTNNVKVEMLYAQPDISMLQDRVAPGQSLSSYKDVTSSVMKVPPILLYSTMLHSGVMSAFGWWGANY